MIGCIRLVNPDRGTALAAITGRLIATSTDFGASWSINLIEGGYEYWPGRDFSRDEIETWAAGCPLSGAELSIRGIINNPADDALGGRPPADNENPETWPWHHPVATRLARSIRPSREDIVELAGEALRAEAAETLPYLDRFEIWACDHEDERPLALIMTAIDLDEAKRIEFSPRWRFQSGPDVPTDMRKFEDRLNARILMPIRSGSFDVKWSIYERRPDGSAIRHGADGAEIEIPPGGLPTGLLAEPWEAERLLLAEKYATDLKV